MQPSNWHVPFAPCLVQKPRATARVLQPSILHTFLLLPCLPHRPLLCAAVLQLSREQTPLPPCFLHTPRATTAVSHPAVEQNPLAPCFQQSPRATTLVSQPSAEQATLGLVSCFLHNPRATAVVVQPSTEHGPLQCGWQSRFWKTLLCISQLSTTLLPSQRTCSCDGVQCCEELRTFKTENVSAVSICTQYVN